ncbi:hypothetical protein CcaverHIS002_0306450 [Cutaneotrichosporon cavernicola]|nr:hypothetical protein CcaverHIS002_0306450 [Cutaneotrichosporon cavernicola]
MDSGSTTADTRTLTGSHSKTGSLKTGMASHSDLDQVENVEVEKTSVAAEVNSAAASAPDGVLEGMRLFLVFLAMMLSVFMFALDQSIVSTAIPVIVSQYKAFDAVAWIVTAYFLTQCGLILLAGQLLTVLKSKWVLLGAIFFFELGSLLCAVANSMDMLIASRAIQGIGASGMFVSIIAIIAVVTRVEKRAAFLAGFGFVFVIASVIGPLLGGVFTEHLSWRWCFWINLPIGGVAAVAVFLLLPAHEPIRRENSPTTFREALSRMDWIGSALAMLFATRNHSAQKSGIDIIPFMIMVCIGIFVSGGFVTKWGRYYPFFIIGPPIAAAGVGMLYTIDAKTSNGFIIGGQILAGFGVGLTFQNLIMSTQAEYASRPELIPQATGIVSFFQLTGAALGIGIVNTVQSVYLNRYIKEFAPTAPFEVVRQSTQAMWHIDLPSDVRAAVVHAYTAAISKSYIPILVALVLSLVFGALIRNHNMLKLGGAGNMHMA